MYVRNRMFFSSRQEAEKKGAFAGGPFFLFKMRNTDRAKGGLFCVTSKSLHHPININLEN